jgi:hypothetical protein
LRRFACRKNTSCTIGKRKRKLRARRSYINRAQRTLHVEIIIRNCIIESRKMKLEGNEELYEHSLKELYTWKEHRGAP